MPRLNLILFFSRGVSLKTWDEIGMFDREVVLYRALQARGVRITFVTYGDSSDLAYAERLPGIRILCNRWRLSPERYTRWLPWLHAPYLFTADVFKANQTHGAEVALRAARRWRKKLIARGGYLLSEAMEQLHGPQSVEAHNAYQLERLVFQSADRVAVTTPAAAARVIERYPLSADKVVVIPNYVQTDLFSPQPKQPDSNTRAKLCFIGRLEPQKNPLALLQAVVGLDVELVVVGSGSLRETMQAFAEENRLAVQFLGNCPNREMPGILNASDLFVLPSIWEGHPKTLLEAMACGLPVIGAEVAGIRELIRHRENGYLCETTAESIRRALEVVLSDEELRRRMGRQAREFVVERFSLERVLEQELGLYWQLRRES